MAQVFQDGKRWYGEVVETDDVDGNYRIRLGGSNNIHTVNERLVELHPALHGPQNWQGERTLGSLMMQTGSLKELKVDGSGATWEKLTEELPKNFQGYPAELCTVYYSPKNKNGKIDLGDQGKKNPDLVSQVVAFLKGFMVANGQWPYIEAQGWYTGGTHVIGIELNYYSDRSGSQSILGFHKDTAGDNIFVNLIFDNKSQIAATEWFPDVEPQGKETSEHQEKLQPPKYREELEVLRQASLYMFGRSSDIGGGLTKGEYSYVSWVDDAVWHATPYPKKRERRTPEEVIESYDDFVTLSKHDDLRVEEQLNKAIRTAQQGLADLEVRLEELAGLLPRYLAFFNGYRANPLAYPSVTKEEAKGHLQQYKILDAENKAIPAKKKLLEEELEAKFLWRDIRNTWIVLLGTLGEFKGALLHNWLAQRKFSVRDVESWAVAAWKGLYANDKASFEQDVNLRAKTDWPTTLAPSEAIAEDPKVGSKSMKQVPPTLSQRKRSNSANENVVVDVMEKTKDTPRRFIRTWVRMVDVKAKEIEKLKGDLL
jgi:hypothetical protein